MAKLSEDEARKRMARDVEVALRKHKVAGLDLGETANFLAQVLGAMFSVRGDADVRGAFEELRSSFEYGFAMGLPEE